MTGSGTGGEILLDQAGTARAAGANPNPSFQRVFIMNTIFHRELVPFLQKLSQRLQCPGEESFS